MLRIVSLAPSNTEILYALGCSENMIAVTKLCDYPEAAKDKERLGTWTETEIEKLKSLKPDVIVTSYYLPEELRSYTGPGEIFHIAPRTLSDVYDSIMEIGSFFGKESEAQKTVDDMRAKIEAVRECCGGRDEKVSVYAEEWWNPSMAGGNWVPEIIEACGGRTKFCCGGGEPSRKVTDDEVFFFNPEMIIAHWCGRADRSDVEKIKQRKNWNHLRAVREGNVYRVDDSLLNRPGPRLADGAEAVHAIIHAFIAAKESSAESNEARKIETVEVITAKKEKTLAEV